jgi:protein-S-isoprenylcysteine O-methyltransferase Ste14
MNLKHLVGCGDKIGLVASPIIVLGLGLNLLRPAWFSVGGPPLALKLLSALVLPFGVVIWIWSVLLIVAKVPKRELITTGPYALVKHPLYTGVALVVLPWLGFLLNSWLGALAGLVLYIASRRFSPEEERELEKTFGREWSDYCRSVKLPWL